jgi:hypothetical protein
VLTFEQAEAKARAKVETPAGGKIERITVRQALHRYIDHKHTLGQPVNDVKSRGTVHILPSLGDIVVAELTAEQLRRWLATMAAAPPQSRPKAGKPQYREAPTTDDEVRARRASANRVLAMLKAALNHAYDECHVANRDAWGRKLKPFRDVEVARIHYRTVAEAQRLINASDQEFRPLLRAALETGCRYSEPSSWSISTACHRCRRTASLHFRCRDTSFISSLAREHRRLMQKGVVVDLLDEEIGHVGPRDETACPVARID